MRSYLTGKMDTKRKFKRTSVGLALGLLLGALATPAMADACKDNLDLVTAAQATAGLSAADNARIDNAKEAARAKQSTGDSDGCLAELAEAKAMLNLN